MLLTEQHCAVSPGTDLSSLWRSAGDFLMYLLWKYKLYFWWCRLSIWYFPSIFSSTLSTNSNKSPTSGNNFSVYLQLNMFRAFSRPSSWARRLQWQPLVFPSYRGESSAVFVVGPAGPTTNTARLSPRYEGKTRGCHCSHWAPDDGRENARNMLSYKQKSG